MKNLLRTVMGLTAIVPLLSAEPRHARLQVFDARGKFIAQKFIPHK